MPGYVIAEITPLDRAALDRYREIAHATITRYGGRHIVHGGLIRETLEGDPPDARRVIVLEFPSVERALEWYRSPEYAEALAVRATAMERRMILVEGEQR
jgi:uncharacterized protein (DUF1330 family)